MKPFVDDS